MRTASLSPRLSPLGLGPPRAQALTSAQPILSCRKAAASAEASQGPNRALAGPPDRAGAPAAPEDTTGCSIFATRIPRFPAERAGGLAPRCPEARRVGSGSSRRSRVLRAPLPVPGAPPCPGAAGRAGSRSRRGIPGVRQGSAALCRPPRENSVRALLRAGPHPPGKCAEPAFLPGCPQARPPFVR